MSEINVKEQIRKFALKSMYGFQTVLTYGIGRQLGIFKYLYEKGITDTPEGKISHVSFTTDDLIKNLGLDSRHVDCWLHMAKECGIFEIEDNEKKIIRTAPHVYDILINPGSMVYFGWMLRGFYLQSLMQESLFENFKTGETNSFYDFPGEYYLEGQKMSAATGLIVERLFSKYCKSYKRNFQKNGTALEVGCGYGLNLENWAKKYKRANFVGIDIDTNGINHAEKIIRENKWGERVKVFNTTIEDFSRKTNNKFNIIILNQVLHEMDPDEDYRRNVFKEIYSLLKDDGMLIVGETMIPDTFAPNQKGQFFNVMHKWLEVNYWSKFYDEDTFKELIASTPFTNIKLIKEKTDYFWAIIK